MAFPNNIVKVTGSNAPGIKNEVLLASVDWFETIANPPATSTYPGEKMVIVDDHIFKTASPALGFVKMYLTPRSSELTIEQVGEIDSEGYNCMLEGFVPNISMALFELMVDSDNFLLLVQDIDCAKNTYYQLGSSCSTTLKQGWKFATGKEGGEGKKGTTVKFDAYMSTPLFYQGAISYAIQP